MNKHLDTLQNMSTTEDFADWAFALYSSTHKNIRSRNFMITGCKTQTWLYYNGGVEFNYDCVNPITGSMVSIICEYFTTLENMSNATLSDIKDILSYYSSNDRQDAQKIINYAKKLANKY